MRIVLALGLLVVSCAGAPPVDAPPSRAPEPALAADAAAVEPASRPVVLSILGTNDLHGHLERLPAFAGFVDHVRQLRKADGGVVLLDAGDMFQGTLESNLNEGRGVIEAMNFLGYTAAALGNHDFDYGPEGDVEPNVAPGVDRRGALRARLAEARFPLLSANLTEGGAAPRWKNLFDGPVLVDVAGVKVGLVGGLTEDTPAIVMRSYFEGLEVGPLAPALGEQARRARALGARVVVAMVHAGGKCEALDDPRDVSRCDADQEIVRVARGLEPGLVDVIVAGHTHKAMAHFFSGIAVVEGWALATHFSRVDVSVPAATEAPLELRIFPPQAVCQSPSGECTPASYEGATLRASSELAERLAPYREKARVLREQPLGVEVTADVTEAHDRESPLGNLLSDLLVAATPGSDIAVFNGGGLRAPLRKGRITYGSLYEAQPFDNRVTKLVLTGAQLKTALAAHLAQARHGIVSVGGATLSARCVRGALVLDLRRRGGRAIRDDEKLGVVTSDYLATGGDDLFTPLGLKPSDIDIGTETVRDALARALRARGGPVDGMDRNLFDPAHPRLKLPSSRPIECAR